MYYNRGMQKAIIITGQTATGKTNQALDLAKKHGGQIISADARQVYTHLDIVTGKDFKDRNYVKVEDYKNISIGYYTIEGIKVWGYDLLTPDMRFSSHNYTTIVEHIVKFTMNPYDLPIIVGGTYLYLQDLLYGFDIQVKPDWDLRKKLDSDTVEELQSRLDSKTLKSMNNSDRNNPRRLIRKIEIQAAPQTPITPHEPWIQAKEFHGYHFASKEDLRATITQRVHSRVAAGAIQETKSVLQKGYTKSDPGLQTIGYKEIFMYLDGELTEEEAINSWITSEVQYAKRQWTFMRSNPDITWHEV